MESTIFAGVESLHFSNSATIQFWRLFMSLCNGKSKCKCFYYTELKMERDKACSKSPECQINESRLSTIEITRDTR
jgi:hypothetical protein